MFATSIWKIYFHTFSKHTLNSFGSVNFSKKIVSRGYSGFSAASFTTCLETVNPIQRWSHWDIKVHQSSVMAENLVTQNSTNEWGLLLLNAVGTELILPPCFWCTREKNLFFLNKRLSFLSVLTEHAENYLSSKHILFSGCKTQVSLRTFEDTTKFLEPSSEKKI